MEQEKNPNINNQCCCDNCKSQNIGSWDEGSVWFCRECGQNDIRLTHIDQA